MHAAIALLSKAPSLSLRLPFAVLGGAFCLLWASALSVAKIAVTDCPPLLVLTARFLLAAVFVFAAAPAFGLPLKLHRRDALIFALLGFVKPSIWD